MYVIILASMCPATTIYNSYNYIYMCRKGFRLPFIYQCVKNTACIIVILSMQRKRVISFQCIYFKLFQSIAPCQLLKLNIRKEAFQFCTAALTLLRRGYGSRSLWIIDKINMPMMIFITNSCTWIYLQYGCIFIQQLLFKICRRLFNLSRVDSNI